MKGARLGAGFAEAAVLAAAGQIQGAADSAPFHSCAKELLPSADQGRQSSGGSDCSTEEAYPPSLSAPQARKPPASNKRSRAPRANTPSPVSEESAESTGPEDGGSRAAKRDRDHGDAGKASGQGEPGKGRRASQPWSAEEDEMLQRAVAEIGPKRWSAIAIAVPGRSGKQCRLRWCNQIDPSIRHDAWTDAEDAMILRGHAALGSRWTEIAKLIPGRTDNAIKNRWNGTLCRKQTSEPLANRIPPRAAALCLAAQASGEDLGEGSGEGGTEEAAVAIAEAKVETQTPPMEPIEGPAELD